MSQTYQYSFSPAASISMARGKEPHGSSGQLDDPRGSMNGAPTDSSGPIYISPTSSSSTFVDYYEYEPALPSTDRSIETPTSFPGNASEPTRYTPRTLGWTYDTDLLKRYSFVILKGRESFLELRPQWSPTHETPAHVYLDTPARVEKNQFPCQYPGQCRGKQTVFGRPADLERHYKNVHFDHMDVFPCDYPRCARLHEPFTRKDHYRDHLRDYHKEDIGSSKGRKSDDEQKAAKMQAIWLSERNINAKYWRCARCLTRCHVAQVGWECTKCRVPCEEERIKVREKLAFAEASMVASLDSAETGNRDGNAFAYPDYTSCTACGGAAWHKNSYGEWESCSACQPGQSYPAMSGGW